MLYGFGVFDVRKLAVFTEVVRCGSMSSAAATTRYTTSAISQQITALERELGHQLLVRTSSGVHPTPAGARLVDHAAVILAAIDAAERDLHKAAAPESGVVRIASFSSAASEILPRTVARLREAFPRTEVRLVAADPDDGTELLREGEVEVCVITEVPGDRNEHQDLCTTPLFDDEFFVVLPSGHRLAGVREVPLAALAAEQWVVSSATGTCPDARVFLDSCRRAGFTPSVSFRAEDYSTVQGLVAAGLGVSLVPSLALRSARDDVVIRPVVGPPPVRRIALATNTPPAPGGPVAALLSVARAVGAQRSTDRSPRPAYTVPARPVSVA